MKRNGWPAMTDEGGPVPGVPENIRYPCTSSACVRQLWVSG